MTKYRLSFVVESDEDPSELLDNLQYVAQENFKGADEASASVDDLDALA